ncbi:hypothetical protein [Nocardia cyriacigeorgica]|uniref:hypothetical protein n=1 Tax=Nocardia cyriacigeorgica TaxID=135487 RepID=UPI002457D67A|nr:hypothetical protein [Nocardia cyriacigeorgica]
MSTTMVLHEGAQAILAQIGNPTPEAPPAPDAGLQVGRWGFWVLLVVLPLAAIGVVVFVVMRVSNSDRRRSGGPNIAPGWAAPGQQHAGNPYGPQPVPPTGAPGGHPQAGQGWNQQGAQYAPGSLDHNGAPPQPGWGPQGQPPVTHPPGR